MAKLSTLQRSGKGRLPGTGVQWDVDSYWIIQTCRKQSNSTYSWSSNTF